MNSRVKAIETGHLLHPKAMELQANWLCQKERNLKEADPAGGEGAPGPRHLQPGLPLLRRGRFFILLGKSLGLLKG